MAGEDERQIIFSYLEDRFGIPRDLFDDYLFFRSKKAWLMMKKSAYLEGAAHLKVTKVGLKAFGQVGEFIKPTTRFIQIFGRFAGKARLQISTAQLQTLLEGKEIPVDLNLDNGYVILSTEKGGVLGLGFLINGRLRSQLPRKEIRTAMLLKNS
ncbi:MAG: hypothetical protein JRJ09_14620 [Deltaproteobacteria bacterium]|nr:hypothetical protein [Deltaproteobacteria bacterium]MBW2049743.1 hypothetical protein [Deltaproteobacteria bacterium]MBW2354418.1 hypothetical protein [Deltaproteobacteria bacterium]HDZ91161.1 hypothetical protein [Deltaproteobacteria bacterium]